LESSQEKEIAVATEVISAVWREDYENSLKHHKTLADFILSELAANEAIMDSFAALSLAEPDQRATHREELLRLTRGFYERIREYGLKQLHFHSPESISLLRLHKPEKFGDSLKGVRKTIDIANAEKRRVSAFEEGRIFNGYRHVFPIFWEGRPIGTVETSFSTDAVLEFAKQSGSRQSYQVAFRKELIERTVFVDMQSHYEPFSLHDDFVVEKSEWVANNSLLSAVQPAERGELVARLRVAAFKLCQCEGKDHLGPNPPKHKPTRLIEHRGKTFLLYHKHLLDVEEREAGIIFGFGPAEEIDAIYSRFGDMRFKSYLLALFIGGATGLSTFFWSIRIQKDAEVQAGLEEARRRSQATFEKSETAQWILDPDTAGFVDVNRAACKHYGYSRKTFASLRLPEITEDDPSTLEEQVKLLENEKQYRFEARHRVAGGRIIDVEIHSTLIEVGGKTLVYSILHDVTERKQAEEALRTANSELRKQTELANQMVLAAQDAVLDKSAFLATMSHEIRTPLNSIVGLGALLEESDLSPTQKDYAKTIVSSSDGLLALINDILDYSKIEAQKFDLENTPFDLSEMICSALEILSVQAAKKNLPLTYRVTPHTPRLVNGDSVRLRQVILNLLSNAIKFTQEGEVCLSVDSRKLEDTLWSITFSVFDTGIGMDAEARSALFKPFSQATASTTRKFGGTGLGLSISQRIITQLESRIEVESEPGKGSHFYFTLQFESPHGTQPFFRSTWAPALAGKRVLIIDKNENDQSLLQSVLQGCGIETTVLDSAQAPLAEQPAAPYHLALIAREELARLPKNYDTIASKWVSVEMRGAMDKDAATTIIPEATVNKPINPERLVEILASLFAVNVPDRGRAMEATQKETPSYRVLVADDNKINQKVVQTILTKFGHNASCVDNGQAAVDAAKNELFDIILMDLQMPVMDGTTATELIRETTINHSTIVVAFTANTQDEGMVRCKKAGMNDFLTKPVRPNEIAACFERNLRELPSP